MSVVFRHVGFEWPDGKSVFTDLSFSLNAQIYGLVGPNGVGKTTLARLISGELLPTSGSILKNSSEVFYFKQIEEPPSSMVAEYLSEGLENYDPLQNLILNGLELDRTCSSLSGGEWTRVRLAQVIAAGSRFLILDEPTNHLDREGRVAVREFLSHFDGGVLLISHDRELLETCESILELSSHGLSIFGGNWSEYSVLREQERNRLFQELEQAKHKRDESERSRHEKVEKQAKRQRRGQKIADKGGIPRIVLGGMKRAAQVTQGKIDRATMDEVNSAVSSAWEAYSQLKIDPVMYTRLPPVDLPQGKSVIEAFDFNFRFSESEENLWPSNLNFSFRGPVRLAIRGPNGSGKSTLLKLLRGDEVSGTRSGSLRMGSANTVFLDQDYAGLDREASILENVKERALLEESELFNLLAMFLFKGEKVHQKFSSLSGGEKLRAALACALLSQPPAQVLILDEPTNNLDIVNIEFLEELLRQYKGALIVVSHDQKFLEKLDLTEEISLHRL